MLKAFLQRRHLRKAFEHYLSPEMARQLVNDISSAPLPTLTERNIDIALIVISACDAANYSARSGAVADIASEHNGLVHSLLPLVVVAFGSIHDAPTGARLRFITAVRSRFPDAAMVHGCITASLGNFGSGTTRFDFGFWWPGVSDAIRLLATLCPGDTYELPTERSA